MASDGLRGAPRKPAEGRARKGAGGCGEETRSRQGSPISTRPARQQLLDLFMLLCKISLKERLVTVSLQKSLNENH